MFEIFQYDFMVRALVAGVAISIVAPLLGTFLVVRRYSLIADTLAHVSLMGVAVSLLVGTQPLLTAVVLTVLFSLGIEWLRRAGNLYGESVLAIFLSGSLAVTTILLSVGDGFNRDLFSYLFGSITTVAPADLPLMIALAIIILIVVGVFYRQLFAVALNEDLARASGIRVDRYNTLLIVLTALVVSMAMRVVGVLLIGALVVMPVLTAMQLRQSFRDTLILAVSFSLIAVISGLILSYSFDLATGGTVVLVALGLLLGSMALRKLASS